MEGKEGAVGPDGVIWLMATEGQWRLAVTDASQVGVDVQTAIGRLDQSYGSSLLDGAARSGTAPPEMSLSATSSAFRFEHPMLDRFLSTLRSEDVNPPSASRLNRSRSCGWDRGRVRASARVAPEVP